jgi:hypothetical protein
VVVVLALAESAPVWSETVLAAAATAAVLGSGTNVTVVEKLTSLPGQPPEPPPLEPPPPDEDPEVELCSVTSATPSIRCRRSSVCATTGWVVAQPLIVKVGTLPDGVAEVTLELAAVVAPELLEDELAVLELEVLGLAVAELEVLGLAEAVAVEPPPTVPLNDVIDACGGSTRPNSCST